MNKRYVILYNGLPYVGTAEQILTIIAGYGGESVNVWMTKVTSVLTHIELDTKSLDAFLEGLAGAGIVQIKERSDESDVLPSGTSADQTDSN